MATRQEYDFQYTPLEGRLPGSTFEQQTEDAINDIGNRVANADYNSQVAIENSETAMQTAQEAKNTADDAETTAENAQASADTANDAIAVINNTLTEIDWTQSFTDENGVLYQKLQGIDLGGVEEETLSETASRAGQTEIANAIRGLSLELLSNNVLPFSNVAKMKETDVPVGSMAVTKGYYAVNDGGAGLYNIRAAVSEETYDNGSLILLDNGNVAELITDGTVNVKQFGAYGDGTHDDTTAITKFLNYPCQNHVFAEGVYNVTAIVAENLKNTSIYGYGAKLNMTELDVTANKDLTIIKNVSSTPTSDGFTNGYLNIFGLEVDGNADEIVAVGDGSISPNQLGCFSLYKYERVYMDGVYVHDTYNGGGVLCHGCNNVSFVRCRCENIGVAAWVFPTKITGSNYQWDGLGTSGVISNSIHIATQKTVVKNCTFKSIAGCACGGQDAFVFECVGNYMEDIHGDLTEDNVYAEVTNGVFNRLIDHNTMYSCGSVYRIAQTSDSTITVNVNITNNVLNNVFGNKAQQKITSRALLSTYNSAGATGRLVNVNFVNNLVKYASDTDIADNYGTITGGYSGIGLMNKGNIYIANNNFIKADATTLLQNLFFNSRCYSNTIVENNTIDYVSATKTVFGVVDGSISDISNLEIRKNRFMGETSVSWTPQGVINCIMPIVIDGNYSVKGLINAQVKETIVTPVPITITNNVVLENRLFQPTINDANAPADFSILIATNNVGYLNFTVGAGYQFKASKAIIKNNIGTVSTNAQTVFGTSVIADNI